MEETPVMWWDVQRKTVQLKFHSVTPNKQLLGGKKNPPESNQSFSNLNTSVWTEKSPGTKEPRPVVSTLLLRVCLFLLGLQIISIPASQTTVGRWLASPQGLGFMGEWPRSFSLTCSARLTEQTGLSRPAASRRQQTRSRRRAQSSPRSCQGPLFPV